MTCTALAFLWLGQAEARSIANAGLKYLQTYHALARASVAMKILRFPLKPKLHMQCHIFLALHIGADIVEAPWTLNPLSEAVPMDEDLVGQTARVFRRVSPRLAAYRTLQRILLTVKKLW